MTDELQPRPEPEPLPEPVVEDLDDDEDEGFDIVEPGNVTRLSPFAVSSFIVALLGAFSVPSIVSSIALYSGQPESVTKSFLLKSIVDIVGPLCFLGVALWLAGRAESEIFLDQRQLGGVGYYRAARILALVSMTLLVLAFVGGTIAYSLGSHSAAPTFP